jgi:hypothetical protein
MKSIGRVLAVLSALGLLMAALILAISLLTAQQSNEAAQKIFVSKDVTAEVIPPISTGPKSRTVMQPWPDAALE